MFFCCYSSSSLWSVYESTYVELSTVRWQTAWTTRLCSSQVGLCLMSIPVYVYIYDKPILHSKRVEVDLYISSYTCSTRFCTVYLASTCANPSWESIVDVISRCSRVVWCRMFHMSFTSRRLWLTDGSHVQETKCRVGSICIIVMHNFDRLWKSESVTDKTAYFCILHNFSLTNYCNMSLHSLRLWRRTKAFQALNLGEFIEFTKDTDIRWRTLLLNTNFLHVNREAS